MSNKISIYLSPQTIPNGNRHSPRGHKWGDYFADGGTIDFGYDDSCDVLCRYDLTIRCMDDRWYVKTNEPCTIHGEDNPLTWVDLFGDENYGYIDFKPGGSIFFLREIHCELVDRPVPVESWPDLIYRFMSTFSPEFQIVMALGAALVILGVFLVKIDKLPNPTGDFTPGGEVLQKLNIGASY